MSFLVQRGGPVAPGKPTPQKATTVKSKPGKYHVNGPKVNTGTSRPPLDDLKPGNLILDGQTMTLDLQNRVSSLELEQTMDGASTLTIVVFDPNRRVLLSPMADTKSTMTFDDVDYTLVGVEIQDTNLTLLFEETAVNVLRGQRGPVKANRYNTTRAEFIHSLVLQPKDFQIPFEAPELTVKQPIAGGKVDVLTEANWITPTGGIKRSRSASQDANGKNGGKGQGWITIGATYFTGSEGSCGSLEGGNFYAELGSAGANADAGMKPLLASLVPNNHSGYRGGLPCGFALDVEYNGKIVRATKQDIGSGQLGEPHYKMDIHQGLKDALGFPGEGDVRIRVAQ